MTEIISFLKSNRVKKGFRYFSIVGLSQIFVHALGFVSGILIIRLLPIEEYALYILANSMLGVMAILSDGGISMGVMSQGGEVWQDKKKLGAVLAAGLDLRRKLANMILLVTLPILLYMLFHHGASWLTAIMICLSIIPAFYAALSDNLFQIPLKLHQSISDLQKNQLQVGLGRLVLNALLLFIFPFTAIANIANGIPRIFGNYRLNQLSARFVERTSQIDVVVRAEIIKIVKLMLPGAAYYAASGQITIWLISIFGESQAIAQLGAIGRVAAFFSIINTFILTLFQPRFSRGERKQKELLSLFFKTQFFLIIILVIFCFLMNSFSTQFLWILGEKYNGLEKELMLFVYSECLILLSGFSFSLSASRGWVLFPVFSISINVIILIIGLRVFNLSTLIGVIYLNLFLSFFQYIMNSIFCVFKINQPH